MGERKESVTSTFSELFKELLETIYPAKYKKAWYKEACKLASSVNYKLEDLKDLSWMEKYASHEGFEECGGAFLSALINKVIEDGDILEIKTPYCFYGLGTELSKGKVIIHGNVHSAGEYMKSGQLVVNGNGGNHVGAYMEGGVLIVNGNVEDDAGEYMKGGTLIIRGNAGALTGEESEPGATIKIYGKPVSFYRTGADVYFCFDEVQSHFKYLLRNGTLYSLSYKRGKEGELLEILDEIVYIF
jgi:hypothetical protein